jgi:7-cyano-7-deazaguanine synthase in queuosine biosynthesis
MRSIFIGWNAKDGARYPKVNRAAILRLKAAGELPVEKKVNGIKSWRESAESGAVILARKLPHP